MVPPSRNAARRRLSPRRARKSWERPLKVAPQSVALPTGFGAHHRWATSACQARGPSTAREGARANYGGGAWAAAPHSPRGSERAFRSSLPVDVRTVPTAWTSARPRRPGEDEPEAPPAPLDHPYLDATPAGPNGHWSVTRAEVKRFVEARRAPTAIIGYDLTFSAQVSEPAVGPGRASRRCPHGRSCQRPGSQWAAGGVVAARHVPSFGSPAARSRGGEPTWPRARTAWSGPWTAEPSSPAPRPLYVTQPYPALWSWNPDVSDLHMHGPGVGYARVGP